MGAGLTIPMFTERALTRQKISEEIICKEVLDVIKYYLDVGKTNPFKNKVIRAPFNENISLKVPAYVHLLNLTTQSDLNYRDSYIESLYKGVRINNNCHGWIDLNYKDDGIYLKFQNFRGMNFRMNKHDPTVQKYFIEKFTKRYSSSDCDFLSLAIGLYIDSGNGHANILFIFKDKPNNKVYLSWYEPYGYSQRFNTDKINVLSERLRVSFQEFVIDNILRVVDPGSEFKIIDKFTASCPVGIQASIGYELGYCALINIFWLYIILKVMKRLKTHENRLDFILNIGRVEKCLISNITKRDLNATVVYFSYVFLTKFYKDMFSPDTLRKRRPELLLASDPRETQKYFYKKYHLFERRFYIQYLQLTTQEMVLSTVPTLYSQKYSRIKGNPEIYDEATAGVRKEDDAKCENDDECQSGICKSGKCIQRPDDLEVDDEPLEIQNEIHPYYAPDQGEYLINVFTKRVDDIPIDEKRKLIKRLR